MYTKIFKRGLDIFFALLALIVLIPIWIPVCIILLLTGEHAVFYFQRRIGYKNRPFSIWKHATMLKDSERLPGGVYTVRNDPRVLPFGRSLRKTKINEIPQLMNILKGDMSFVGPRPLVERTFNLYPPQVQETIYNVLPGLTGIGSVIFRDEEKLLSHSNTSPEEFYKHHIAPYKGALELWYQQNLSLITDIKIIFLTAWVIFFPSSKLPYRWFKNLPPRPTFLDQHH